MSRLVGDPGTGALCVTRQNCGCGYHGSHHRKSPADSADPSQYRTIRIAGPVVLDLGVTLMPFGICTYRRLRGHWPTTDLAQSNYSGRLRVRPSLPLRHVVQKASHRIFTHMCAGWHRIPRPNPFPVEGFTTQAQRASDPASDPIKPRVDNAKRSARKQYRSVTYTICSLHGSGTSVIPEHATLRTDEPCAATCYTYNICRYQPRQPMSHGRVGVAGLGVSLRASSD
ncbi:hypothetical protein VTK56DRAFT_1081 [Thermocarpiscus australiensis]